MVVLRQSENRFLGVVVPDDDVRVLSSLSRGKEGSVVRDSQTSDLVIMGCHEVLVVRVLNITNYDTATSNEGVVFASRVEVDSVLDLATETN